MVHDVVIMVRLPVRGLPAGVRLLEHTADTGIEVTGTTLEECFARAAAGMFACFVEGRGRAELALDVELQADGAEELLVAWLEELLFRAEVSHLLFLAFEVAEVGRRSLRARVRGRALRREDQPTGPEVKAVTRHLLAVERSRRGWRARVVFDV